MKSFVPVDLPQVTKPPAPLSGRQLLYPKSDGRWYTEDANGIETPLGSGGYPPFANTMVLGAGNIDVTWTSPSQNIGSTMTVTSMGPDDVFLVSIFAVVFAGASIVNFISFSLNGAAWNDGIAPYVGGGAQQNQFVNSQTVRMTGLAAGTHTIGIRSWNNAAGTSTIVASRSALTVVRIGGAAGGGISTEYTATSTTLAAGAESPADVVVTHNLGVVPSVVAGHLEDGSWAHQIQWRVSFRTTTTVGFRFLNHGPNAAQAVLRFRLITAAGVSTPDTEWTSLTVTANMSGTISYCRRGGNVYVEMAGTKSGTSGVILGTLPAGFRPSAQVIRPSLQGGGVLAGVFVEVAGNIKSDFGTGAYGGFSFPAALT